MGRVRKRERKLLRRVFKEPKPKRDSVEAVVVSAAGILGVSTRKWAKLYRDGDRDAKVALRSAASADDRWKEHFEPASGERDWEGFFSGFGECLSNFLPLFITFF